MWHATYHSALTVPCLGNVSFVVYLSTLALNMAYDVSLCPDSALSWKCFLCSVPVHTGSHCGIRRITLPKQCLVLGMFPL
jgi:hypothetical protein